MKKTFALLAVFSAFITININAQEWAKGIKADPNATFYDIQKAFNDYYKDRESNRWDDDYTQFRRWEAFMEPRVYPTGKPFNQGAAYEALMAERASAGKNGSINTAAGNWSPLGPNLTANLFYTGLGRVNSITYDPSDTNKIWVGTSGGGIWKSNNGGAAWTEYNGNMPTMSVADVAVDPSNGNIIYAATGDPFGYTYFDNYKIFWGGTYSTGVIKSINGGVTWVNTGLNYSVAGNNIIHRLLINPNNPAILLAAASNGVWRTTNSGTSWTLVKAGYIDDIEFNAGNPNTVYAATDSVFRSTDGGATWNVIASAPVQFGRLNIETTLANPSYIYLLQQGGTFYRSTDAGTTWTAGATANASFYGYYDCILAVSPTNAQEVWCAGSGMCKSINGGTSWTTVTNTVLHPDNHSLEFLPNGKTLMNGSDGGFYKTSSAGTSWVNLTNGLAITQFYRLGCSATNSGIVYAGAQDNGSSMLTAGAWKGVGCCDGMECVVDYTNSQIAYISSQYGNFRKTTDGGTTWTSIPAGGSHWTTPFIMHPSNPQTLFVGTNDVSRSTNGGTSFTPISTSLSGTSLYSLAIAPSNPNYIYAASYVKIWRTTVGGTTWTDITGTLPVTSNSLTYVAVSGKNPDVAYAVFSGYSAGQKVYKTTNGGTSWTNISGTLPNVPVNCIVYDNNSLNDAVYCGTDIGVYYMDNNTGAWQSFNTNMPNVMIFELEIHYGSGKIRAATYGRGVWESPLSPTTDRKEQSLPASSIGIYPNPSTGMFQLDVNTSGFTPVELSIYNVVGEKVSSLKEETNGNGHFNIDLSRQPAGIYFAEVRTSFGTKTEKLFVNR